MIFETFPFITLCCNYLFDVADLIYEMQSVCLSVHLEVFHLSVCLSFFLFISMFFICLSVCLSVCLSTCLWLLSVPPFVLISWSAKWNDAKSLSDQKKEEKKRNWRKSRVNEDKSNSVTKVVNKKAIPLNFKDFFWSRKNNAEKI